MKFGRSTQGSRAGSIQYCHHSRYANLEKVAAASYITGAVIDLDGYSAYSRFISMFGKSAESELLPKRAA